MFNAMLALKAQTLFSEEKENLRELPASPIFFGVFTFAVLMLMLYLVLLLYRDWETLQQHFWKLSQK